MAPVAPTVEFAPALGAADEFLVAPVKADALPHCRPRRIGIDHELAADRPDSWIGEVRDQRPHGARVEALARVSQSRRCRRARPARRR